ncbi:hypothetical protein KSP40_PGU013242 [Platanthera guangdongensis]|uniref:Uncharacterized protein n=1 Tax=Platanthera guangdongensis TaxID=2320717 RepID=A0ABR2M5X4_9ASPA
MALRVMDPGLALQSLVLGSGLGRAPGQNSHANGGLLMPLSPGHALSCGNHARCQVLQEGARSLQCLYNECPEEFDDLTFKYLTNIPQNQLKKSAPESTRITPVEPEKAARSDLASSSSGHHHRRKSERDHGRRRAAEEDVKREQLARGRGRGAAEESMPSSPAGRSAGQTQPKGNPHSNICALCASYINLFRHRCLVSKKVFCKEINNSLKLVFHT